MFPHHRHYHEKLTPALARLFEKRNIGDLKIDLWNAFVDSDLLGINEHDCSAIPRFLPASYLPVIKRTCRDITEALMKILSLPSSEMREILPPTPISNYLIEELGVLRHRPRRLVGSLRLDMAVEGKPSPSNPPKLMEVNDIGFDGSGRSSYIQETLLRLFPELKDRVICFDTARAEVKNIRRLGRRVVRFQYETYNWEEEVTLLKAQQVGLDMKLVSPTAFDVEIDEDCTLLTRAPVRLKNDKLIVGNDPRPPDAFQLAYSFELKDFLEAPKFFRDLIRSKTHHYSPFITGLIAPKTILVVLSDEHIRRRLLGARRAERLAESIVPARILVGREEEVRRGCNRVVIKYADGMGGEHVHIGKKIRSKMRHIRASKRKYWVAQDRIDLNTIDADGFLSRRRRVVADVGVYIHYDWNGTSFESVGVSGFITRATNRGFKVNVSGGGIQVPVMFDRSR